MRRDDQQVLHKYCSLKATQGKNTFFTVNGISNFFSPCSVAGVTSPLCPTQVSITRPSLHSSVHSETHCKYKTLQKSVHSCIFSNSLSSSSTPRNFFFLLSQSWKGYLASPLIWCQNTSPLCLAHNFILKHPTGYISKYSPFCFSQAALHAWGVLPVPISQLHPTILPRVLKSSFK